MAKLNMKQTAKKVLQEYFDEHASSQEVKADTVNVLKTKKLNPEMFAARIDLGGYEFWTRLGKSINDDNEIVWEVFDDEIHEDDLFD